VTYPALPLNGWMRWDHVRRLLPRLDVRSILEIGAGSGAVAVRLAARYEYLGLEPDPTSFARTQARLTELGRGRVLQIESSLLDADARFDLVCAFEVLEHVEDDLAALQAWRAHVRPGGWLLLSMPAHQRRFSAHDRVVGHYRRYDPKPTADLLRRAGYSDPVVLTCGFPLGYALEVARNTIGHLHGSASSMEEQTAASGHWLQPPDRIGALTAAVTAPFRLLQRPFARSGLGTGLVVLAQSR
jgi:SAM-dependent methyltransferase